MKGEEDVEVKGRDHEPKNASSFLKLRKNKGAYLTWNFQKEYNLDDILILGFLTSNNIK
jgi:hypothetical protein